MSDTEESDLEDFSDDEEVLAIQKKLLQQRIEEVKHGHEETTSALQEVFSHLKEFLRHSSVPYKVVGGTAVTAWLNPKHQDLSPEELAHIRSTDWDIEILGDNKDALTFARKIVTYLEAKTGNKFDKRFEDVVSMPFLPGFYVYQIGIADGPTRTEWIIDIHGQKEEEFHPDDTVVFDGIRYPNLKVLIDQITQALEDRPEYKGTKRLARKMLLQSAMKDIHRFNPPVYKLICTQCRKTGAETLTGFNLDCEQLEHFCA